jgi:gamma-glutamyltranspeptidase/glutathione hydrolase
MTNHRHRARTVLVATIILSLALPAAAKTPVATGTGGAVATINDRPRKRPSPSSTRAATPSMRPSRRPPRCVTDPFSCGIGGGGFMVIYLAKDKRVITIDHRETAPASFTPTVFLKDGKERDFEQVVASGMSVGVPGTVRGWHEALDRYGSMSLPPGAGAGHRGGRKGFKVNANFNHLVQENEAKFAQFPATAALYLRNGKAIPAGSTLRNPDLAKAYRELASGGVKTSTAQAGAAIVPPSTPRPTRRAGPARQDDAGRPGQLRSAPAPAGPQHLPRLRFVRHAAAQQRRHRHGRSAQHPGRL